jgi:hypothetical protein
MWEPLAIGEAFQLTAAKEVSPLFVNLDLVRVIVAGQNHSNFMFDYPDSF